MKISGLPGVQGIYDKLKSVSRVDKSAGVSTKKDVLSISDQAKDYQTVMKAMKDIPDVRTGIVNELAEKYDSGTYNISGNEIADKILNSIIDKKA